MQFDHPGISKGAGNLLTAPTPEPSTVDDKTGKNWRVKRQHSCRHIGLVSLFQKNPTITPP
jgi:hypothetical protein